MAAPSNYALTKNEVITEMVSCDVCCEKFKKTLDMAPKLLVCLHTFCAACLKRLVKNGTISCPTCRKKTTLGAGGVDGLGSNFTVSRLSDVVEEASDVSDRRSCQERREKVKKESSSSLPSTMLKSTDENCKKHPEEQMKMYCRGCSEVLCCFCAIMKHNGHNLVSLNEAVEAERIDVSELCVEASSMKEKIEVELQKLEQKRIENLDRSQALHLKIDQGADEVISRINVCRQKAHEDVDVKISSLQNEIDKCRLVLDVLMSRSEAPRAELQRVLETSNAEIFGSTCGEAKKLLISVLNEDANKVDGICDEEVMLSVATEARDLGKTKAMFEIRAHRVGSNRSIVLPQTQLDSVSARGAIGQGLLSRGAGIIGQGHLGYIAGSIDVLIPAYGSVEDALVFVPEWNSRHIKVFSLSTGALVRDFLGERGAYFSDVLVLNTGPLGIPELYVSDYCNNCIAVLDPMTGVQIRSIGRGRGAGVGQLSGPLGLMMHRCLGSGIEFQLYVSDFYNNRVEVFNPIDGAHIRSVGQGQLVYPRSCTALSEDEGGVRELYISEGGNHRVSVFDMATGAFKRHIGAGRGANAGQMDDPRGIAMSLGGIDSEGGDYLLYVSEFGNNRIQIFNARTGTHVGILGVGELDKPCGIRLHGATGNRSFLFVSEWSSKRIRVYEL